MYSQIVKICLEQLVGCGASSADRLVVADLSRDEELLHGHVVEEGEVADRPLLAVGPLRDTEVLLQVDGELSHHDGVLHVRLNPLKALNALLAGVPVLTDSRSAIFICKTDLLSDMTSQVPMVWQM